MKTPNTCISTVVRALMILMTSFLSVALFANEGNDVQEQQVDIGDAAVETRAAAEPSDRESREGGVESKSAANPKFKCKLAHKVFGTTTSPPTPEIDLICPSGHFVTTASCSQKGSPVLNSEDTPVLPPIQTWADYLILNGNGFARGVHCKVFTGKAVASAMCCANY